MSTRFVSFVLVVLVLICGVAAATAESYSVDAVVVSFETTPWGDLEIVVFDEDGNLWGYFADIDEDTHIGDVVILTIFHCGDVENDKIIDVVRVDHLDLVETIQWIQR